MAEPSPKPFWPRRPHRVLLPKPTMGSEIRHDQVVRILAHGGRTTVWHTATGEVAIVEGEATLRFDENNMGYLVFGEKEGGTGDDDSIGEASPRWLNSIFDLSLHKDDAAEARRYIYDKKTQRSSYLDQSDSMRLVDFRVASGQVVWSAEVYAHEVPRSADGAPLYFCMPFIQDKVFGNNCHNRWVCRRFEGFMVGLRLGRAPQK